MKQLISLLIGLFLLSPIAYAADVLNSLVGDWHHYVWRPSGVVNNQFVGWHWGDLGLIRIERRGEAVEVYFDHRPAAHNPVLRGVLKGPDLSSIQWTAKVVYDPPEPCAGTRRFPAQVSISQDGNEIRFGNSHANLETCSVRWEENGRQKLVRRR